MFNLIKSLLVRMMRSILMFYVGCVTDCHHEGQIAKDDGMSGY